MDAVSLLERLQDEFVDDRGYLRRKIDGNACLRLLSDLKSSLPRCLEDARGIVENKRQILQNADSVAQNTVQAAQQRARDLVSDGEIDRLARKEADKIVNKALMQRDVLIDKTKRHLEEVFNETERFLLQMLETIRKNKQELKAINFS